MKIPKWIQQYEVFTNYYTYMYNTHAHLGTSDFMTIYTRDVNILTRCYCTLHQNLLGKIPNIVKLAISWHLENSRQMQSQGVLPETVQQTHSLQLNERPV